MSDNPFLLSPQYQYIMDKLEIHDAQIEFFTDALKRIYAVLVELHDVMLRIESNTKYVIGIEGIKDIESVEDIKGN